jgi:RNA polymerase sigma-70 factor (ECF subfamily)
MEMAAPVSDEELVRKIAAGDRVALGDLYDRYAPMVLAQARRILRNDIEAEDLVHDVYLEVFRCAHTYETARGSVRAWLSVRVRSRALDRLKRSRLGRRVPGDVNDAPEVVALASRETASGLKSDAEAVRRALGALPAEQRTVLELFYFDGLSLPEIGEKLSVPLGTVKSRASRGIGRLRAELAGRPEMNDAA